MYLVVMTTVADDIDSFDDVRVLESGTDAELGGNLLLVFLFRFTRALRTKLLDSKYTAAVLSFDQADCTSSAGTENSTPFTILLCKVRLCGLG